MSKPCPNEIDRAIGRKIKHFRAIRGITQMQLAAMIGKSFQQVQKYEVGTNRVPAGGLPALAKALGVRISDFFEEDDHLDEGDIRELADARGLMRDYAAMDDEGKQTARDVVRGLRLVRKERGPIE